jgi:hypothetical protein
MKYLLLVLSFIQTLSIEKVRVGIIGSGIGGLNLARLLRKFENFKVDVLEAAGSVGGRIQTMHIDNKTLDVGAVVFKENDKYLNDLIDELNLKRVAHVYHDSPVGIYGKEGLLFEMSSWDVINTAKLAWRYGLSPFYFKMHLDDFEEKHKLLYRLLDTGVSYKSLADMIHLIEMSNLVNITMSEWVKTLNLNNLYAEEMINATLNSIFNQNDMSAISGLFALSKIGKQCYRVDGGNGLIPRSIAEILSADHDFKLHLNTGVRKISKTDNHTYEVSTGIMGETFEFDILVIATPFSISSIHFGNMLEHLNSFVNTPTPINLHVTYLEGELNPDFFKGANPKILLTKSDLHIGGIFNYGDFFRIHSRNKLTKKEIEDLKIFKSYKLLHDFAWNYACGKFDPILNFSDIPSFVLDNRLFYLSAHETITTGMDISLMSSKNIANMIEDLYIEKKLKKDDI